MELIIRGTKNEVEKNEVKRPKNVGMVSGKAVVEENLRRVER